MKCTVIIDNNREEEVIIYAHRHSALTGQITALTENYSAEIIGYRDRIAEILNPDDVVCFISESNKTYAITENGKFRVKERLYSLEERLNTTFIRINQSCIASVSKIHRFEPSPYGSLSVVFTNGLKDYVSRRNLKNVKERLGI